MYPPTTYDDLAKVAQYPKFIPYQRIMSGIKSVYEIMPALILYESMGVGHWCCLFENIEGINYFDSQGGYIDDPLKHVDQIKTFTYLRRLLAMQNKTIMYNEYQLQHEKNTCGYWCAVRLHYKDVRCDDFARIFKQYPDMDMKAYNLFRTLQYTT